MATKRDKERLERLDREIAVARAGIGIDIALMRNAQAKRRAPSPAVKALVEACRSYFDSMANDGYVDFYAMRKALAAVEREIQQ